MPAHVPKMNSELVVPRVCFFVSLVLSAAYLLHLSSSSC